MQKSFLTLLLVAIFCSCGYVKDEKKPDGIIAEVGNYKLTIDDLNALEIKDLSPNDSLMLINNFVENWLKEKLVLQKAELNLDQDQKNFKKQLEDYRTTLLIYSYEKELIKQKLDTIVSDTEIEAYYNENPQNFKLINDVVKIKYLKVPINAPKTSKIKKLFLSTKEKEKIELKEYAHQYAEKFYFEDDDWIQLNDLKKEAPISMLSSDFLKNNTHLITEDSLSLYFIYFKDYRLKNDLAPLSFEKDNIKNIILNKRKLNLLKKIKSDLYYQAIENKEAKLYINPTSAN